MGLFGGLFDVGGGGGGSFSGGGIGSSQSAQQSQSTTTTLDLSRIDNSVSSEGSFRAGDINIVTVPAGSGDPTTPGAAGAPSGNINISTIDPGALQTAREVISNGMDHLQSNLNSVTSLANDSINQAYQLAQSARQSETSGAINALTKYLFWVAVAGIGAYVIVKGKK